MRLNRWMLAGLLFCLACSGASAEKFDRGFSLKNPPIFVPKGHLLFGGTVSYRDYQFFDYKFVVLDNLDGKGYMMNVSPYVSYFFADNLAAGARFAYKRSMIQLDEADLSLGDGMSFGVRDYYSIQHTYYGAATFRSYLPLGESRRFGLFNELQLVAGAGQSKILTGKGETLSGTFQHILELGLQVVPGVCVFVTNEMAVEASVGIMGLRYKKVSQLTNQVFEGSFQTSSADFKVDIFSINIGVSFFIPVSRTRIADK